MRLVSHETRFHDTLSPLRITGDLFPGIGEKVYAAGKFSPHIFRPLYFPASGNGYSGYAEQEKRRKDFLIETRNFNQKCLKVP